MASTTHDLSESWDIANKFSAAADTDVLITSTHGVTGWVITATDALPVISVQRSHIIPQGESRTISLVAGERLWLARTAATLEA